VDELDKLWAEYERLRNIRDARQDALWKAEADADDAYSKWSELNRLVHPEHYKPLDPDSFEAKCMAGAAEAIMKALESGAFDYKNVVEVLSGSSGAETATQAMLRNAQPGGV
jgi:hypothetical protein